MNYKVVYFTRTGTSKRIAEKIAEQISAISLLTLGYIMQRHCSLLFSFLNLQE